MHWKSLRKGSTRIHVGAGLGFDLAATETQYRLGERLEVAMTLDGNLRVRSSTVRSDAAELAEKLGKLTFVQITDAQIIDRLADALTRADRLPNEMVLILELRGSHRFTVQPDLIDEWNLFLRVAT